MIIQVYSDPGHAWAKVPLALLFKLGIVGQISHYSYIRKGYAYLEEDGDLSALMHALKAKGIDYVFKEHISRERRSRIRGYDSYSSYKAFVEHTT